MMRRIGRIGLSAAVLLGAAACADVEPDTTAPSSLEGDWVLEAGDGPSGPIDIVEGHRPTLTIDGERWRGQVCNIYDTTVAIDGSTVSFDGVSRTEMACMNGGIMESEDAYLDAFGAVSSFEVADDGLRLVGQDVALDYQRVEPTPDVPLVGTTWQLESLVDGDQPDSGVTQAREAATFRLDEDGTLLASTGCRELTGPYRLEGDTLELGEVGSDDVTCEDAHLVGQDSHVEATLLADQPVRASVDGDRLELVAPSGRALHYRAM